MKSDEVEKPTSQSGDYGLRWAELLECYRREPNSRWSALLLERLGPWLTVAKRNLPTATPYLDADDVAQELGVEVLRIATRWRPRCEDGWIPRRLVERAARKVHKALLREVFSATEELSDDIASHELTAHDLVYDTPIGKATAAELRILYRFKVLREPIEKLASESHLNTSQMRRRIRVALARARATTSGTSSE